MAANEKHCQSENTFSAPLVGPLAWGDGHQNARRSARKRPRSPYKMSASSVQQFRMRYVPNIQQQQTNSRLNISH